MKQIIEIKKIGDLFTPKEEIYDKETDVEFVLSGCTENDAQIVVCGKDDNGILIKVHNKLNGTITDILIGYQIDWDKKEVLALRSKVKNFEEKLNQMSKTLEDIVSNLEV